MGRSILSWVCVFAFVALPVGGCGDETTAAGGSGGTGGIDLCEGIDCDDGNECTEDTCADGVCDSAPVADDTACGDDAGTCQQGSCRVACDEQGIRNAITAGGGPYTFDCDGPTTVVTEAEIIIDNDVILDGEGSLTVDGNDDHRVFWVDGGVATELVGVAVTGGRAPDANVGASGSGIFNRGEMTLTNCRVFGNRDGVGCFSGTCSGLYNGGTLTVTNSTVSGNESYGILNEGTLTLTNSTVSGNSEAPIAAHLRSSTTLTNSTVSGNLVFIEPRLSVTFANSVMDGGCPFVGNLGLLVSEGHNIESPGDTCGFVQATDQVDVSTEELALGPLQDNGGPTETHALLPGSVAIDVIPADMCAVDEDQRGVTRPQGTMCDVGAFEVQEGSL